MCSPSFPICSLRVSLIRMKRGYLKNNSKSHIISKGHVLYTYRMPLSLCCPHHKWARVYIVIWRPRVLKNKGRCWTVARMFCRSCSFPLLYTLILQKVYYDDSSRIDRKKEDGQSRWVYKQK